MLVIHFPHVDLLKTLAQIKFSFQNIANLSNTWKSGFPFFIMHTHTQATQTTAARAF